MLVCPECGQGSYTYRRMTNCLVKEGITSVYRYDDENAEYNIDWESQPEYETSDATEIFYICLCGYEYQASNIEELANEMIEEK